MELGVRMNDFRRDPPALIEAEERAAARVLRSGWYVLGREVEGFERAWADYCGLRHAVGVGNGLDAIEIGLRALGIGAGDEVVTTPMTAFATVLAVLRAGATPVLADIDPDTGLLDRASVERCLSDRTRAVLLVHLFGQMRDMPAWIGFCAAHGVQLIEDCAQAHGARQDGRAAGVWGRLGAYSFYPTKNLGTAGDGGALATDDDTLAVAAASLRNYGQTDRYRHDRLGLNSRLDELHAALLTERLGWLDGFNARRRAVAARYRAGLRHPAVRLLASPQTPEAHVHHLFVVRCAAREALAAHLRAAGIETQIHYPVPVHRQAACPGIVCDPQGLPAAERFAAECLSLPCHPNLADDDVDRVIAAVNAFDAAA